MTLFAFLAGYSLAQSFSGLPNLNDPYFWLASVIYICCIVFLALLFIVIYKIAKRRLKRDDDAGLEGGLEMARTRTGSGSVREECFYDCSTLMERGEHGVEVVKGETWDEETVLGSEGGDSVKSREKKGYDFTEELKRVESTA